MVLFLGPRRTTSSSGRHVARRRVLRYYTRLYPVEYTLRYSTEQGGYTAAPPGPKHPANQLHS